MLEAFRQRKLEVQAALGGLCDVARSVGANTLAGRVADDVIAKLEADCFHLVVVGEFNHGKTTFVNALLGDRVLPVGVTPTTAVIHHIVHATEPRARLVQRDGEVSSLEFEHVRDFAVSGERDSERVKFLEVGFPADLLSERIVLVDTPGVNDLSLTRAEITYGYIPRSDAVLFVLDAGQPVKESERQFLEQQLIGKSRDKIVFVVAKSDIWSDSERGEALDYVRNRLSGLVENPAVFAISALAALEGRRGESGLDELEAHLKDFLAEERGKILLSNALGEGLSAASVLARGVEARRRAASMSAEQIARRVEMLERDLEGHADTIESRRMMIREQVGAIKARSRANLDRFCDDTIAKLPSIVEAASADDVKQHLGAFLERSFKEWATAETGEMAGALEELAERVMALVREDANEVAGRVSETMGGSLETPRIEVDSFGRDIGTVAVLTIGVTALLTNVMLGGALIAAASALAMWSKGRTEAELKRRALELAPAALREAAGKVAPKLDEMVDEFADRLDQWVVTAGEELHREVIEVLQRTRAEREEGRLDREAQLAACERETERLAEVKTELELLRARVTGGTAPVASVPPPAPGEEPVPESGRQTKGWNGSGGREGDADPSSGNGSAPDDGDDGGHA